jgi:hypothetical protein
LLRLRILYIFDLNMRDCQFENVTNESFTSCVLKRDVVFDDFGSLPFWENFKPIKYSDSKNRVYASNKDFHGQYIKR